MKYTESQVATARKNAKTAAANRYGVSGTNVTSGMLDDENLHTKQTKLGGE